MQNQPIGFFDSGVGGLSVMRHAALELPNESFVYYGDNANAPYGDKSEEEIQALSLACGEFLVKKGVKAILVACNTATSVAVRLLREKYCIPVVSMEPAVKPAREVPGRILVLATAATISQARYNALLDRLDCRERVVNLPCIGLAQLIEKGDFYSHEIECYLEQGFKSVGGEFGSIVIGCTHYSFISDTIAKLARRCLGGECRIFDGMFGTVRRLKAVITPSNTSERTIEMFSSAGNTDLMEKIFYGR